MNSFPLKCEVRIGDQVFRPRDIYIDGRLVFSTRPAAWPLKRLLGALVALRLFGVR